MSDAWHQGLSEVVITYRRAPRIVLMQGAIGELREREAVP